MLFSSEPTAPTLSPQTLTVAFAATSGGVRTSGSAAPMAVGRYQHTATVLADGRVLVAGGVDASGRRLAAAEVFDPATGSWSWAASMHVARSGHTATLLPDGRVLVTGGLGASNPDASGVELTSAEIFDPKTGAWRSAAGMRSPRALHTATPLRDGRILVVGGSINRNGSLGSELYDPTSDRWVPAGTIAGRVGHSATLLGDGSVLMAGGSDGRQPGYLASTQIYHPASNTWTDGPALRSARSQQTATLLHDGRVVVVGGTGGLSSTELYDPAAMRWTDGPDLGVGRVLHSAVLLPDGRVVVAGGSSASGIAATSEVFEPP